MKKHIIDFLKYLGICLSLGISVFSSIKLYQKMKLIKKLDQKIASLEFQVNRQNGLRYDPAIFHQRQRFANLENEVNALTEINRHLADQVRELSVIPEDQRERISNVYNLLQNKVAEYQELNGMLQTLISEVFANKQEFQESKDKFLLHYIEKLQRKSNAGYQEALQELEHFRILLSYPNNNNLEALANLQTGLVEINGEGMLTVPPSPLTASSTTSTVNFDSPTVENGSSLLNTNLLTSKKTSSSQSQVENINPVIDSYTSYSSNYNPLVAEKISNKDESVASMSEYIAQYLANKEEVKVLSEVLKLNSNVATTKKTSVPSITNTNSNTVLVDSYTSYSSNYNPLNPTEILNIKEGNSNIPNVEGLSNKENTNVLSGVLKSNNKEIDVDVVHDIKVELQAKAKEVDSIVRDDLDLNGADFHTTQDFYRNVIADLASEELELTGEECNLFFSANPQFCYEMLSQNPEIRFLLEDPVILALVFPSLGN